MILENILTVLILAVLIYIAFILTNKNKEIQKEEQKKKIIKSKSSFTTPLQTYKDFDDNYKDKKRNLYTPIKPKGRGVEIKNDKG